MDVQTVSDQLFFTTVHVHALGPSKAWRGTAFIYSVPTNQGQAHLLVTNKHVFQDPGAGHAETITFRMIQSDGSGGPRLGKAAELTATQFGDHVWIGHPNEKVDVAAMPFQPVLEEMTKSAGVPPFFRSIASASAMTVESARTLDSIEDVCFVGYPSGLYDETHLLPIARRGTTATPPAIDHNGLPAFLVDASVFPGSSGSPVTLFDTGMHRTRDGGLAIGGRPFIFMGVISAVHARVVEGSIVITTGLGATFEEPIDLGIVYKASAVDECADLVLARYGLTRTAHAEAEDTTTQADEKLAAGTDPIA